MGNDCWLEGLCHVPIIHLFWSEFRIFLGQFLFSLFESSSFRVTKNYDLKNNKVQLEHFVAISDKFLSGDNFNTVSDTPLEITEFGVTIT